MLSCSNELLTHHNHQNAVAADASLSKCGESHLEHEDEEEDEDGDEEEDVDFYPIFKATPSMEASSSLSFEVEGLDVDVVGSGENTRRDLVTNLLSKPPSQIQDYAAGDSKHGEEIVLQTAVSSGGACEKESEKSSPTGIRKRKSDSWSCQPENETFCGEENGSNSGAEAVNDMTGECGRHSRRLIMDIDDEDAICMRTRARYSLASFTLDELETFLQETDDDDDLQNVDDEEEYRKFLAAVLLGGGGDSQTIQENENVDDEDEDNDADFEIEIEEALESDFDENTGGEKQVKEHEAAGRRPETRQNRRQRSSAQYKKRLLKQTNRPLRPLLPNVAIVPFPVHDGKNMETSSNCLSSSAHNGLINGFTPHQLGQLYCLVHEHLQLLIQVFSLCIFDPSHQCIASQAQELISEMLHRRDKVLSGRRVPYPSFCFCPPYIHPSVPDEPFKSLTAQSTSGSSCTLEAQRYCSSGKNRVLPSDVISPLKEGSVHVFNREEGHFQTTECSFWVPLIKGPVLSVLDAAPLNLVGKYIDDVSTAVQEYQHRQMEATCDPRLQREPLFSLPSFQSSTEANGEVRGTTSPAANPAPPSPASDLPPKKTLAAALVERTKKQSVAVVPREIAKLALRFFPLFNPALFPHKPPLASVVNRVLFTDSEDELLALGLMEYNTDWKAIQQRFLPCKSKHQIFVRQKNRSSSKAPENPIKAVRRMKNSPLTAEEMAQIQEGLKVFKLDWMSVWKFTVPYRDPSLLPRQWRVATGTQKTYKSNVEKKEKRRLYALHRRKCKSAASANWQTSSEKEDCHTDNAGGENNSGDDCMDNKDEAYVHEAFLADWRPDTSSKLPVWNVRENNPPSDLPSQEGSRVWEQTFNSGSIGSHAQSDQEFHYGNNYSQNLHNLSRFAHARHCATSYGLSHPISDMNLRSSKSQLYMRPYRARRANSARLVKLAPDLPPINLPRSVRVMSQSAFKSYQGEVSTKISAVDAGNGDAATENLVGKLTYVAVSGTSHLTKARENKNNSLINYSGNLHPQESGIIRDKCIAVEKYDLDLQMHPLLFQASQEARLPCYPLSCNNNTCSSFNLFSGNQPQLNLSLFHNPPQANHTVNFFHKSSKETTSSSCNIDFHPLLQRADDVNSDLVVVDAPAHLSDNFDSLRGNCVQLHNSSDAVRTESQVSSCPTVTSTKPSSPSGKANELDLEIHLSFASRKEKVMGSRDVIKDNQMRPILSAADSGIIMETQNKLASIPDGISSKVDSSAHALVMSSNNINRYDVSKGNDLSLPEIVMDQEELSDSEEEVEEHVEFECEEMDDSEGEEGSESEQIVDLENKEVPYATVEEVAADADFDNQQCKTGNHSNWQGNVCGPSEASTLKLDLTEEGKDKLSSSLCLSLNSCAPGCPPDNKTKPKSVESRNTEGSGGKNWMSARPNRSCKKTMASRKDFRSQKEAGNMPQKLELGPLLVDPLKKPRKRACRTNSSFNMG
ncbi:uncharacterized protein LOC132293280 [Cornus florida]|uniref:uncharacterized protein LOC132293280 n=1 Tax=Cornus florida TaxID=4283 RepID=UPI0028A252C5|nr:uncharacterized protein LOC132293280 [Cornus florida]